MAMGVSKRKSEGKKMTKGMEKSRSAREDGGKKTRKGKSVNKQINSQKLLAKSISGEHETVHNRRPQLHHQCGNQLWIFMK